MSIETFGHLSDGTAIEAVRLSNGGLSARLLGWGAVLQELRLEGHEHSLVLGLPDLDAYLAHSKYFGATAGRCANRIAGGRATIDGREHRLDRNFLGKHTLHGGSEGTGRLPWRIAAHDERSARLEIELADGHMGFPGRLAASALFTLTDDGALDIVYRAETDRPTLCNLAHHSYFVLDDSGDVLDHELQVRAERYLPVDDELIPTGEIAPVEGTAFDFRRPRALRDGRDGRPTLDHNFCLSPARSVRRAVARLSSPRSGIELEVSTTEPGLQVYDGALLDVPVAGLDGRRIGPCAGIALEPQVWPDSPHHPDFPQASLAPGETYRQHTRYAFRRT